MREQIVSEIKAGVFVFSNHFPDYRFIATHEIASDVQQRTFKEWYEVWAKLAARDHEASTMMVYKRVTRAYWLPVFGGLMPAQITHEKVLTRLAELAETGLGRKSQNNIMIPLRKVWELIDAAPGAPRNPCLGVKNLKLQRPQPDPFSPAEVELVLAAMRDDAIRDYFEFSFFAGLRVSEQIALRWADVDFNAGTILVHRSKVDGVVKDRTKTNVERSVELNDRAAAVLLRQKARTLLVGAEVFWNPATGRSWHDEQGQAKEWNRAIRASGVRYRAPKEARDTSVTMALMAPGVNPVWVANQHGHSVQVMLKSYAKWIQNADRGSNLAAVNRSISGGDAAERRSK
jgi:integrase